MHYLRSPLSRISRVALKSVVAFALPLAAFVAVSGFERVNAVQLTVSEVSTTVVAADGSGNFKTVQEAVNATLPKPDAAPNDKGSASQQHIIKIKPGTYKEKLVIPKECPSIKLIGTGTDAAATVLTFGDYADILQPDGTKMGTFNSSSVLIKANDFTAENLTFENSHGQGSQALAIFVMADRVAFYNCHFLGWQDTILVNEGRQYFDRCTIAGHVDFIFGAATAFFDHCIIHCLEHGYITAASTPQDHPYGFVFADCTIIADPVVNGKHYLGRPWRPYASVTYLRTEMPKDILPFGWENWRNPANEKTARYAEYKSTGPGANPTARAPWTRQLTDEEAAKYTVANILGGTDGWNPVIAK